MVTDREIKLSAHSRTNVKEIIWKRYENRRYNVFGFNILEKWHTTYPRADKVLLFSVFCFHLWYKGFKRS